MARTRGRAKAQLAARPSEEGKGQSPEIEKEKKKEQNIGVINAQGRPCVPQYTVAVTNRTLAFSN